MAWNTGLDGLLSSLGNLFSGGTPDTSANTTPIGGIGSIQPKSFGIGDLILPGVGGYLTYLGLQNQNDQSKLDWEHQQQLLAQQQAFTREQNALQLAQNAKAAEAQAAAQKAATVNNAYSQAQNSTLGAGELNQQALQEFIRNLQYPLSISGRLK